MRSSRGIIEIRYEEADIERVRERLGSARRALPSVISRAINRTAQHAHTRIVEELVKVMHLKKKIIRPATRLIKATRAKWEADIDIYARRVPLINFGAKQTTLEHVLAKRYQAKYGKARTSTRSRKEGVKFRPPMANFDIFEGRKGPKLTGVESGFVKSAFINIMPSGHKGVFRRKMYGDYLVSRLPIVELFGPPIAGIYQKAPGIARRITDEARNDLGRNITTQINLALAKRRAAV